MLVVAALLGFVGTVNVARFIERRGALMLDVAAAVLILTGVTLGVGAGLGLQRFPDVFPACTRRPSPRPWGSCSS